MAAGANPGLGCRHMLSFLPRAWIYGVQGKQGFPGEDKQSLLPPAAESHSYQPGPEGPPLSASTPGTLCSL